MVKTMNRVFLKSNNLRDVQLIGKQFLLKKQKIDITL
jgi:hypothetical protein